MYAEQDFKLKNAKSLTTKDFRFRTPYLEKVDSPIGILGKTKLFIEVNDAHKSNHEFYVASEMLSEVILGLDWLVNNQVVIDTANMLMKFPDLKRQPLLVFDAALKDPTVVV